MTPNDQLQLALKVIKEDWDGMGDYANEKFRYLTEDMGIPKEVLEQACYLHSVEVLNRGRSK